MITATGWSLEQVDSTPWPVVTDLFDYWKSVPPVHLMLKRIGIYLGIVKSDVVEMNTVEKQVVGNVKSFKHIPKHLREFASEASVGKVKKLG
jgi:hypothetical protein